MLDPLDLSLNDSLYDDTGKTVPSDTLYSTTEDNYNNVKDVGSSFGLGDLKKFVTDNKSWLAAAGALGSVYGGGTNADQKTGYQGVIPRLSASRSMITAPPTKKQGYRPGAGGIDYGGDVTYALAPGTDPWASLSGKSGSAADANLTNPDGTPIAKTNPDGTPITKTPVTTITPIAKTGLTAEQQGFANLKIANPQQYYGAINQFILDRPNLTTKELTDALAKFSVSKTDLQTALSQNKKLSASDIYALSQGTGLKESNAQQANAINQWIAANPYASAQEIQDIIKASGVNTQDINEALANTQYSGAYQNALTGATGIDQLYRTILDYLASGRTPEEIAAAKKQFKVSDADIVNAAKYAKEKGYTSPGVKLSQGGIAHYEIGGDIKSSLEQAYAANDVNKINTIAQNNKITAADVADTYKGFDTSGIAGLQLYTPPSAPRVPGMNYGAISHQETPEEAAMYRLTTDRLNHYRDFVANSTDMNGNPANISYEKYEADNPLERDTRYQLIKNNVLDYKNATPEQSLQAIRNINPEVAKAYLTSDGKVSPTGIASLTSQAQTLPPVTPPAPVAPATSPITQKQVDDWFKANPNATPEQVAQTVQSLGGLAANSGLADLIGKRYGMSGKNIGSIYSNLTYQPTSEDGMLQQTATTTALPINPKTGQPGNPFDKSQYNTVDEIIRSYVDFYGPKNAGEKNQLEALSLLRNRGVSENLLEATFPTVYTEPKAPASKYPSEFAGTTSIEQMKRNTASVNALEDYVKKEQSNRSKYSPIFKEKDIIEYAQKNGIDPNIAKRFANQYFLATSDQVRDALTNPSIKTDIFSKLQQEGISPETIARYTGITPERASKIYTDNLFYAETLKPRGNFTQDFGTFIPDVYAPPGKKLAEGGMSKGRYLQGGTDGMADEIPAQIGADQPAALSHGEFVIPADVVSHMGNGNSDAGAKKLYQMMDKIRMARTGNKKQGKKINPDKFMPGGLASAYAAGGKVKGYAGETGSLVTAEKNANQGITGVESNLSNWAGPYVTNMLAQGQALANMPYTAYKGPLTAGASDLQNKVSQGLQGINFPGNLGQSFASPMGGNTNNYGGPGSPGPGALPPGGDYMASSIVQPPQTSMQPSNIAQSYMNPYLQSVLNPQLDELQRRSQINLQPDLAKLTQAGGFGGGRQAIMQSEANRNLLQEQNKTVGQGYASAFDKAMGQFNTEQGQAKTLVDMMSGQGATDRSIDAEGIAADKKQFEEARANPYKMVEFQQSLLQGLPLAAQSYQGISPTALTKAAQGATTVNALLKNLGLA
jgi:hypothetical protein